MLLALAENITKSDRRITVGKLFADDGVYMISAKFLDVYNTVDLFFHILK
jgi:hypothetical protein